MRSSVVVCGAIFFNLMHAGLVGADGPAAPRDLVLRGLVLPEKSADLAMRVPGVVLDRPVTEGQFVEEGTPLLVLESEYEKAVTHISELEAGNGREIEAASLDQALKQEDWDRVQDLMGKSAATKWEVSLARLAFELAKVYTDAAEFNKLLAAARSDRDRIMLESRTLRAPFSGWVHRTHKDPGEGVDEFEPVIMLIKLDSVLVELNVSAVHFGRIHLGDLATIESGNDLRDGVITVVDSMVDTGSSTYRVRIRVDNSDRWLVAGTMANVTLNLRDESELESQRTTAASPVDLLPLSEAMASIPPCFPDPFQMRAEHRVPEVLQRPEPVIEGPMPQQLGLAEAPSRQFATLAVDAGFWICFQ